MYQFDTGVQAPPVYIAMKLFQSFETLAIENYLDALRQFYFVVASIKRPSLKVPRKLTTTISFMASLELMIS
jgi:hypothetical protein